MQALRGFPPTFSDGWKNTSTSFVLSLSEMVGASGSESDTSSSNCSPEIRAAVESFSAYIKKLKLKTDTKKNIILMGKSSSISLSDSTTRDFFEFEAKR